MLDLTKLQRIADELELPLYVIMQMRFLEVAVLLAVKRADDVDAARTVDVAA